MIPGRASLWFNILPVRLLLYFFPQHCQTAYSFPCFPILFFLAKFTYTYSLNVHLSVRDNTIKFLEENTEVYLWSWARQWFLSYYTKKNDNRKDKLNFVKIKNICFASDTIKKWKDKLKNGRKYFSNRIRKETCIKNI